MQLQLLPIMNKFYTNLYFLSYSDCDLTTINIQHRYANFGVGCPQREYSLSRASKHDRAWSLHGWVTVSCLAFFFFFPHTLKLLKCETHGLETVDVGSFLVSWWSFCFTVRKKMRQNKNEEWSIIFDFVVSTLSTIDSLLVELRTRDWKVPSSSPGRSGGGIFFSRANFVCWLLFGVRSTPVFPHRSFCQKWRWQVTPKHAYTLDPTESEWADYVVVQA